MKEADGRQVVNAVPDALGFVFGLGPPNSRGPIEPLKDAGDELRMPRTASCRRHPALRQLGGHAAQRQALLF
jgi:hypothetical protein